MTPVQKGTVMTGRKLTYAERLRGISDEVAKAKKEAEEAEKKSRLEQASTNLERERDAKVGDGAGYIDRLNTSVGGLTDSDVKTSTKNIRDFEDYAD